MRRTVLGAMLACCVVAGPATVSYSAVDVRPQPPTLVGFARLPAISFAPGTEPSGAALGTEPINGVVPPFGDQPIQGFSGVVRNRDGSYAALADNGYGTKANSADFLLRIHRIMPAFGSGRVKVQGGITLRDPGAHAHFPLTRPDRILTGADFDPESIVRAPDGSYWIGEEFGPFLLHFDRRGNLLQRPIAVPGVKSRFSPDLQPGEQPNLGGSKGLESLAISPDGRTLYPMLEGPVTGDDPQHLRLYEFDRRAAAFTGRRWTYPMAAPQLAAADLVTVDAGRFLAIERDNLKGDAAAVKKIYLVTLPGDGGQAGKAELVDLLNIANPRGLGFPGPTFRFPFFTIEAVTVFDDRTIGVLNDNNFPFDATRRPDAPDDDEFIAVRLPAPLT